MPRNDFYDDLGFEQPYKDSPVDHPENWHGGAAVNTGGSIYARIWQSVKQTSELSEGDVYYEVIYGPPFDGADLNKYKIHEDGYGAFEDRVDSIRVEENGDIQCADAALELMERANNEIENVSPSPNLASRLLSRLQNLSGREGR